MSIDLCGEPTHRGPCTMPKNHKAAFHRHIDTRRIYWVIEDSEGNALEHGKDKVPLDYAIRNNLDNHDNLTIKVTRG